MYVLPPPMSKRDLLDRMLSDDFDGDFRNLGHGCQVSRVNASTIKLRFDVIDRTFLLSAHIPRSTRRVKKIADDFSVPLPPARRQ